MLLSYIEFVKRQKEVEHAGDTRKIINDIIYILISFQIDGRNPFLDSSPLLLQATSFAAEIVKITFLSLYQFSDFKATFDSIRRDCIWASMRHYYGLPEKYVRIFQAFFNETVSAVRVDEELQCTRAI